MPPIASRYDFLGQAWTFWPSYNDRGSLNVISGARRVAHEILSVLLIKKGEVPHQPDFGLAPDIFQPLSEYDPEYWVYHAEEAILKWVKTISELRVSITGYDNANNQLNAEIYYLPISSPNQFLLNFPFWLYQGAIWDGELETFLDNISINGQSFKALT